MFRELRVSRTVCLDSKLGLNDDMFLRNAQSFHKN